jgi:hypothetical protein
MGFRSERQCDVCKQLRPDDKIVSFWIDIHTHNKSALRMGYVRYCRDNDGCRELARRVTLIMNDVD